MLSYWNKATSFIHIFLNLSSCSHNAEYKVGLQVRDRYLKHHLGIWGLLYSKYNPGISTRNWVADNRFHFFWETMEGYRSLKGQRTSLEVMQWRTMPPVLPRTGLIQTPWLPLGQHHNSWHNASINAKSLPHCCWKLVLTPSPSCIPCSNIGYFNIRCSPVCVWLTEPWSLAAEMGGRVRIFLKLWCILQIKEVFRGARSKRISTALLPL